MISPCSIMPVRLALRICVKFVISRQAADDCTGAILHMPDLVASQATLLYRLQMLDQEIAGRRTRLKAIAEILGNNAEVQQAQSSLIASEKALAPWSARARDLDLEIKGIVQKIATTDARLYSGKVTNPKELGDMQQEIASLKRHQSQLEDDLLEAMLKTESGQAEVSTSRQALEEAKATWSTSQADLIAEKGRLEVEVENFERRRKEATIPIDPGNLSKYEALRPKKRGTAVALLKGDSCMTCGVEQTSMLAQQVRQGKQIIYCEACGRILATP